MILLIRIVLKATNILVSHHRNGKINIFKYGNSKVLNSILYYGGKLLLICNTALKKSLLNPNQLMN